MWELTRYSRGFQGAMEVFNFSSSVRPRRLGCSSVLRSYNGLNTGIPDISADLSLLVLEQSLSRLEQLAFVSLFGFSRQNDQFAEMRVKENYFNFLALLLQAVETPHANLKLDKDFVQARAACLLSVRQFSCF